MSDLAWRRNHLGRFISLRPCRLERIVGGYWCHTHRRWADTHDVVVVAAPHPYEAGSDNVCIHCGVIGSYGHQEADR